MNYNILRNKPTINYRELIGDSTVSEVGGITEEEFNTLINTDLASYYTKAQIDELFARSFVYREKSGSIVTFDCPSSITTGISSVTSDIVAVQSGTGDPSPTNVRPFTGWSAVNVYDTGKNLFDTSNLTIYNRYINTTNNTWVVTTDGSASVVFYCKPSTTYTLSYDHSEVTIFRTALINKDPSAITEQTASVTNADGTLSIHTITTSDDTVAIIIQANRAVLTSATVKIQVELGTTSTTYEPYNSTTYTTQLKDGQGNPMTCYGGQLVNENGVQRLTLTHGYIASYNGETLPSTWISDRDVYVEGTTPTTGAEVVYTLATPQQIPQDSLSIATQEGTNNIWANSGDVTVTALDKIIQG